MPQQDVTLVTPLAPGLPVLPPRSAHLGDDVPGAGAQFVDLCLGDVGALLGIVQLVPHLAELHQVGVGLLFLGRERGKVGGSWGTGGSRL